VTHACNASYSYSTDRDQKDQSQFEDNPGQIVTRPYLKTHYKKRVGGAAQGVGTEFKPKNLKKKKKWCGRHW
jgi:hypothetical protein